MKSRISTNHLHVNRLGTTWRRCPVTCLVGVLAAVSAALAQDPLITIQPTNQTVSLGGTAVLTGSAVTDYLPLSVQRQCSDRSIPGTFTNIPGAIEAELKVVNVTEEMANEYRGIVANGIGNATTSQVARLIIDPTFIQAGRDLLGDDSFLLPAVSDFAPISLIDYDRDGWLEIVRFRGSWYSGAALRNEVYENNRNGTFTRITNGLATLAGHWTVSPWSDFDSDGDLDCLGTQVHGSLTLFSNQLSQGSTDYTYASEPWLPGDWATCVDYDSDGWTDVAVTCYGSVGGTSGANYFAHNVGGQFQLVTDTPFALSDARIEWSNWVDYDNDGDLDLLVTQEKGRPRLFQNDGAGALSEVWVGTPTSQALYNTIHGIWADYDNDGFPDLLMERLYTSPSVLFLNNLRQAGNQNHWLKVQLKGTASNAGGLGATLHVQAAIGGKVVRQVRELGIFGGLFASDFIAHFGLGDATKVDLLRIEWPSGIVQELTDLAANQFLTIEERQVPQPEQPKVTLASRGADGVFQATVTCATPGARCVLEASPDLAQWTKVQVRTNSTGTMEFSDPSAATQPTRFYRVVAP